MVPYRNPINRQQENYISHKSTRILIEHCFGRLKKRFNILHQEVRHDPEFTTRIIATCAILHNIAIERSLPDCTGEINDNQPEQIPYEGCDIAAGYRDHIANTHFL